ncbi:MAG: caspase family protein [Caldilineaceae bacterium]
MTQLFEHGYALLIGVDDNRTDRLKLPDVAKDLNALSQVLVNAERCAYPEQNIKRVQGAEATRAGILAGFAWLQQKIAQDNNATAVVYYSGHGYQDVASFPQKYYLVPYDADPQELDETLLPAAVFEEQIAALQPKRLLVLLDCCHAGGVQAKSVDGPELPGAYISLAFPAPTLIGAKSVEVSNAVSKDVSLLAASSGRAVLSSSQGNQKSYMRIDGQMSVFTYHLIEALTGHAQPEDGAKEVLVSDVLSYVHRKVPQTAGAIGAQQQPHARLDGVFPVALLLGGKGLAKGMDAPDPLADVKPLPASTQINNTGSGAVATGGGVAAGERGIAIGGQVSGGTFVTGDGATIDNRKQSTKIDTGGGAYIGGGVQAGGDFVGRDKVVQGDDVRGDKFTGDKFTGDKIAGDKVAGDKVAGDKVLGNKVGGDDINVGDVSGSSGIAIGRNASSTNTQHHGDQVGGDKITATVGDNAQNFAIGSGIRQTISSQGIDTAALDMIIAQLMRAVLQTSDDAQMTKAMSQVHAIQAEAQKAGKADDGVLADLVSDLVDLVPGAVAAVVTAFASPILAGIAGPATQFVLKRLGRKI